MVLDFFAGSASTAHAVYVQNREDGGNRRCISVQLPDSLPAPESVLKRYTDVGKQRLSNVIARLKNEAGDLTRGDARRTSGSRCSSWPSRASSSGCRTATAIRTPTPASCNCSTTHSSPAGSLKTCSGRWPSGEGFGLNTRFATKTLPNGNTLHEVTDPDKDPPQNFTLCLDEQVRADLSKHHPLTPGTLFICRDKALDDSAAANLASSAA